MRSPLAVLFLTIFIDLMGFGIIIPILPQLSIDLSGSEYALAIAGIYSLMNFVFSPFWGSLSDRYGRRPIILVSILLTALANYFFGFVTTIWMLALQRALSGIGSANISAANAYIADISTPATRTKNMGLVGAAFGLGFIFGPGIGGYLSKHYGLMGVGIVSGSLSIANLIMAYFMLPESLKEKTAHAKFNFRPVTGLIKGLKIKITGELFIMNFVFTTAFSMMQITASVMWAELHGLDEEHVGYVFSFIGLCSAIVQGLLVGKLNKKFGERKLLYYGFILMAVGLTAMPFIPKEYFWLEMVSLSLLALANGCITPSILGLLSMNTSPQDQGKIMGLNQSAGSLARVLGPVLGGATYAFNYHAPYIVGGVICLASLYLVHDLMKKRIKAVKPEIAN